MKKLKLIDTKVNEKFYLVLFRCGKHVTPFEKVFSNPYRALGFAKEELDHSLKYGSSKYDSFDVVSVSSSSYFTF